MDGFAAAAVDVTPAVSLAVEALLMQCSPCWG